ncbi:hypothetical protein JCM17844_28720 [Iodidimonas gelatinilytica]|uniref:Uncharacterized protein n=1 Tax=Iodidimonas gelatinilytica TaxID=1236966 RepID=A0A5A7MWK5_9PROT|nr:hypothetical protein [Iodidimonas gelatinilytica]GEQ99235.1 hypothetical protein JCM17844_28720 [Iodidimonas gelatinilytica]
MTSNSTRLSVTPVGRAVAMSVLHPSSANQLIKYAELRGSDLLSLAASEENEKTFRYTLLHAAYSSYEYSIQGSAKNLPYQLNNTVQNKMADAAVDFLIEQPWQRNPLAANAAMLTMRWAEGRAAIKDLAPELPRIGSGVAQTMIRESAEILFAWSDCLIAATANHRSDDDCPTSLQGKVELRQALRNLASAIRMHARSISLGLPGEVAWMGELRAEDTGYQVLSRPAILALHQKNLADPIELLRSDSYEKIIEALKSHRIPHLNEVVQNFREAVRAYRDRERNDLWEAAIKRASREFSDLLREAKHARGKDFETKVENLLNAVGLAYKRLDDGKTAGAADLQIGLNHKTQIIMELKTSNGNGAVKLNSATDVVRGAAIVGMEEFPKATLANPGFDPNVPWQARNIRDLALVEASQFAYVITRLANNEIDKDRFLDWLAQPGMLSSSQIHGS